MKIVIRDNLGKDVTHERDWYVSTDGVIFYETGDIDGPLYMVDNDYTFSVSDDGGSAETEPVIYAYWIETEDWEYPYRCSSCTDCADELYKRCPNCGAHMRGKIND